MLHPADDGFPSFGTAHLIFSCRFDAAIILDTIFLIQCFTCLHLYCQFLHIVYIFDVHEEYSLSTSSCLHHVFMMFMKNYDHPHNYS